MDDFRYNRLIPEFAVRSLSTSLPFYEAVLGFRIVYKRPEEGFAFLDLDGAQLMLDQIGKGRDFDDFSPTDRLGLGVNLQIGVSAERLEMLRAMLDQTTTPLHVPLEDKWYRKGMHMVGNRQFVVADPDGYLLRFAADLGQREL